MRWKDKQISVRIGVYGSGYKQLSLSDARDEWQRLRTWSKEEGRDPRDLQKEEKRLFVDKTNNPTLLDAVEGWLKNISIAPSTKRDYENKLFNQVIPHFGGNTPIAKFAWSKGGRERVLKLKAKIEIRGSGSQANRVFMVMKQVFEYAIDRSWLEAPNLAMSSSFTKSKHIPKNNPCLSWNELPKLLNDLNTNRGNGSPIAIAKEELSAKIVRHTEKLFVVLNALRSRDESTKKKATKSKKGGDNSSLIYKTTSLKLWTSTTNYAVIS